jgi:GH35 family endo-1,4-beta-xylanase
MTDTTLHTVYLPMMQKHGKSLKLGNCTHPGYLADVRHAAILKAYYNVITPEVAGGYWWICEHGWGDMDKLAEWCRVNNKDLHYHCLRWHWGTQPPDPLKWITEVLTRYPMIHEWIVVNEGFHNYEPTIPLIDESYLLARKLRPDAILWYNGLFLDLAEHDIINGMVDRGLVDAVGLQWHIDLDEDFSIFEPLLVWLRDNRVKWRITEMDVIIPMTDAALIQQADQYRRARELVEEYGGHSLGMWGVADCVSWQGEDYRPLPLDEEYRVKPAWEVLVDE